MHVSEIEQARVQTMRSFVYLLDDCPARTVGHEHQLMTATVFPVRGKQVVHIIQELPTPTEDIKLSRDEHPISCASPKAPGEYPGIAAQIWEQVSGPVCRQITCLISLLIIARPSCNRGPRSSRWALPQCWSRAAISAGPSSRDSTRPRDCDGVG